MKQRRSFALMLSGSRRKFFLVTTIVSSFVFQQQASAQRAKLDVQPSMVEKETSHPPSIPQSVTSRRFIKGIVTDNTGDSLVGVSVRVQLDNEKTGTASDENGEFYFEIPSSYTKDSLMLRIAYLGCITQECWWSLQENDYLKICLVLDPRDYGCPVITPTKQQKITDLVKKPDLIKIR